MSSQRPGSDARTPDETRPAAPSPAAATAEAASPSESAPETTPEPAAGRIYSGLCPSDRASGRYGRLIEAGIDVIGTQGYAKAKVKTLCQRAGLSERYFYESFDSREDLLTTVYDHLATAMLESARAASIAPAKDQMASAMAGTGQVVDFMLGDPRHGWIILVEVVGISPELEAKRHQTLNGFANQAMHQLLLLSGTNPREAQERLAAHPEDRGLAALLDFARLTAVSVVGGINNMLLDSLHSGTVHNTPGILDVSRHLISNASRAMREHTEK